MAGWVGAWLSSPLPAHSPLGRSTVWGWDDPSRTSHPDGLGTVAAAMALEPLLLPKLLLHGLPRYVKGHKSQIPECRTLQKAVFRQTH